MKDNPVFGKFNSAIKFGIQKQQHRSEREYQEL